MGGDHGPAVTLPACRSFLEAHPQAELVLVGTEAALKQAASWPRCTLVVATEVPQLSTTGDSLLARLAAWVQQLTEEAIC